MLCATCGTRYELKEIGVALVRVQPAMGITSERVLGLSSGDLWKCIKCGHGILRDIGEEYAHGELAQRYVNDLTERGVPMVKQMVPW